MAGQTKKPFDFALFLATEGPGRIIQHHTAKQAFFFQGGPADSVFYLQDGRAKLTVVSKRGKEATVTMLASGDFFGEESIAEAGAMRTASAMAVSSCVALKIERNRMLRVLHEEHTFSCLLYTSDVYKRQLSNSPHRQRFPARPRPPRPRPSPPFLPPPTVS